MAVQTAPMTRAELRARVSRLPRLRFAHLPTPLEPLPRLSEELGGPRIYVKRDDATGLAFGGNKARHYEFEMAYLRENGYNALVNVMDYHSNNARVTAAAANRAGIRYVLILRNAKGRPVQGNLLVDKVLGAELHLLDSDASGDAEAYAEELGRELEREGFKPYVRPGKQFPKIVGSIAYLDCALELARQLDDLNLSGGIHIFGVAGRSTAGLRLAAKNLGLPWKATGVTVNYDVTMQEYLYDVIPGVAEELGLPVGFDASDMTILDQYVGEGYGIPTPEVIEAIHRVAKLESLILDPNYTGTVMAGLIDQIGKGRIDPSGTVVFLHTGGTPALFTFADQLWEHRAR